MKWCEVHQDQTKSQCPECYGPCSKQWSASPAGSTSTLKDTMYKAVREAERAAHAYAASCGVGEERTRAFEVYERIRLATRR